MRFFTKFFLSVLLIFLAASCAHKPAKIVNNSKNFYSKNSAPTKKKLSETKLKEQQVEVAAGETLYSVAKKYRINQQDLITQNNLSAPYILKAGGVLTIPQSTYHQVQNGETLYAISRAHNMKIDKLIELNNLQAPYSVKVGQQIKIASQQNAKEQKNIEKNEPLKKPTKISEESAKKSEEKIPEKIIEKPSETSSLAKQALKKINPFSGQFSWPIRGTVISKFGPKSGGLYNDGINIKAKEGAEVKASESGVVAYVGNELKGYGNLVIIKHSEGWITAYAHLSKTLVARGQKVDKNQKIGAVGSSGNVSSPQLYFGLRKGRDAVNPQNYLKN